MRALASLAVCICAAFLTSCGLAAPALDHADDSAEAGALFVNAVTTHVHCELRNALFFAYDGLKEKGVSADWLREWAAKVTLTVNVDEKSSLGPGVTLTRFFPSFRQTLSNGELVTGGRTLDIGLGGSLASTAAREQEITWFIVFADLFQERKFAKNSCETEGRVLIDGDLKIKQGLFAGVFPATLARNISDPFINGGRLQVVQHQVSFLVEASGNITPTWRFVDVSANAGGQFLGGTRNRKDTLLMTMGPTQLAESGRQLRVVRLVPSGPVETSHTAKQIGNNVGSSLLQLR